MFSEQVAKWRDDYGIDGIDLDLEEGAGSKKAIGEKQILHFEFKQWKMISEFKYPDFQ